MQPHRKELHRVAALDSFHTFHTTQADLNQSYAHHTLAKQVLSCWSVELQAAFLDFATGTARLPAPGSELLKVECPFVAISLAENKQQLGVLPQV